MPESNGRGIPVRSKCWTQRERTTSPSQYSYATVKTVGVEAEWKGRKKT